MGRSLSVMCTDLPFAFGADSTSRAEQPCGCGMPDYSFGTVASIRTTFTLDDALAERARQLGINLSAAARDGVAAAVARPRNRPTGLPISERPSELTRSGARPSRGLTSEPR